ncbi:FTR1 family protein [Alicyclobacillus tolerans]|uniref:FTR1 family iron permease n=1 Tax=Alicyclobacillus tolerans TaxID=90970 RepID=UPI001F02B324|nr:FTR1 family protein [Alicyclobacillus tolerans]MCF8564962.1 FTR1 family protein [Alicyclobacillus tolerans]
MFDGALLVSLREGVEISLILGIIFSYLRRLNRPDGFKFVWLGTLLAALLAALVGVGLYVVTGSGQEWAYQTYLEASVMLLAVVILSYMTFWMKKNSRLLGKDIQQRIQSALDKRGVASLTFLAFITVIREGIETVMFLLGLAYEGHGHPSMVVLGTVVGFAIAAVLGWVIYKGTYKVNLTSFFQVMGTLLIVVAAGLLATAIGSLIEAHVLSPVAYVFNWTGILNQDTAVGAVLHALVGYSDHPSILQAGAWAVYLVVALVLYNRRNDRGSRRPRTESVMS